MERNWTEGGVFRSIVGFSLPFLLSNLLQVLYGLADLYIVGQFGSTADITAVSGGSQVMHMLTVMLTGLAMGATVTIGQHFGAGEARETSRSIGNTLTLFLCGSLLLTLLLTVLANPIVSLLSTPAEAVEGARRYLTVCFLGIPFITAYNVLSAILRGLGDSKSPLYFIVVACFCNIALDYLCIGVLGMGPMGAALATVLAQAVSVAAAAWMLWRRKASAFALRRGDLLPHRPTVGQILKIGVPVSLQDGFIQVSFLLITVFANRRGLDDAAAVGIVEKFIGVLFLVPSSLLATVSALAAQNLGAGKPERAKQTLRYAIFLAIGFGIVASISATLLDTQILAIFEDDPRVIALGATYLRSYVIDCVLAGIHFVCSGYFCAIGKSGISFLHNALAIVLLRVPVAYWASLRFPDTLFPMGLAAPMGSLLSVCICFIALYVLKKKSVS